MAQEIVTWCDLCLQEEERSPARTVTVTIDKLGPRALDLCGVHQKELVEPLRDLLEHARPANVGQAPLQQEKKRHHDDAESPLECPVPDCPYESNRRSGVRHHAYDVHKLNLAQLEAMYLKTHTIEGKKLTHVCPYCDPKALFSHGAGLGTHIRSEHPDKADENTPDYLRGDGEDTLV